MNKIVLSGKQDFMGMQIPIVLGGFGEGKKCISDRTISEIHKVKVIHMRKLINKNINRFVKNVDFIDLKELAYEISTLINIGYAKQSITQAKHIYILSERGYLKLIKIMNSDLAWDIYERLLNEYFHNKSILKNEILEDTAKNQKIQYKAILYEKDAHKEEAINIISNDQLHSLKGINKTTSIYGYVYFLEYGSYVKIGSTKTPYERIHGLSVYGKTYGDKKIGRVALSCVHTNYKNNERKLHDLFSSVRKHNTELFSISLDDAVKIANKSLRYEDKTKEIIFSNEKRVLAVSNIFDWQLEEAI